MTGGYISAEGMAVLKAHKYVGSEATWLDARLTPFWDWVTALLPRWLAPNLITFVAFLTLMAGCVACVIVPDAALRRRPSPLPVLCALAGFIYQTLDAVDGKQARRLGKGSPLGQLFDHGCDCVGMTFWTYMLLAALDCRQDPVAVLLAVLGAVFFFYPAQFAEYFTHRLVTSSHNFGVTETQFVLMLTLVAAGLSGPALFGARLPRVGVSPARVLCGVTLLGAVGLGSLILADAYRQAADKALFWRMLVPAATLLLLTAALFCSPARRHPTLLYFLCMLSFNAITLRMIVSSLTHMPYPWLQVELAPLAMLLAAAWAGVGPKEELRLGLGCALAAAAMLCLYAVGVVRQMSLELRIPVFTV